jgi:hypothetical protein
MHHKEHILDKYIMATKTALDSIPDDSTEVIDTSFVQMMCLEKFANYMGYFITQGLFVQNNEASRVMTLDNMVALYNNTMKEMDDLLKGHGFVETVYLAGRSLRKPVKIQHHKIKFL